MKVTPEELANMLSNELVKYVDEISDITKKATEKVSKDALKILKENAPVSKRKSKGRYKKSLSVKTQYEGKREKRVVLYSKSPHYRLTHLLEKGHATKGKRFDGKPHFKQAEEYADNTLTEEIIKGIEKLN